MPVTPEPAGAGGSHTVRRRGPGSRADESHPTRQQLLDAALRVADRNGLTSLSVNDVTREAGVAKGTFYVHFPDRTSLLVALHRRFHDELFERIATSTNSLEQGPERAHRRLTAFMEGCRDRPGVRSVLLEARSEPAVSLEVTRRNDQAARTLVDDLRRDPPTGHELESARLIVAAAAEAASLELAARRRLPKVRAALDALVDA